MKRLSRCRLCGYLITLFILLYGLTACQDEQAQIGRKAPAISALDLQDKPANLPSKPLPTLLTFWSASCGVCIAELQTLAQLSLQYPDKFQLLAINIDGDQVDLANIIAKYQLTMPIAQDQLKITAERYQVIGTPTSFLLNHKGIIQGKFEGLIPQNALTQLVGKP